MTDMLDKLIARLKRQIERITASLAENFVPDTVKEWLIRMQELLARYMTASWMVGAGKSKLPEQDQGQSEDVWAALFYALQKQFEFLANFAKELLKAAQNGTDWDKHWDARAGSYSDSIAQAYSQGAVYRQAGDEFIPLPAYPGDMTTQCGTRCRCEWQVAPLKNSGDYNCIWRLDPNDAANCQTCEIRAARWQPLRVRNFELLEVV